LVGGGGGGGWGGGGGGGAPPGAGGADWRKGEPAMRQEGKWRSGEGERADERRIGGEQGRGGAGEDRA